MGLYEGTQEVLALTHFGSLASVGQLDRSDSGIGCRTIHLHAVLVDSVLGVGCQVETCSGRVSELRVISALGCGQNKLMIAGPFDPLSERSRTYGGEWGRAEHDSR